MNKKLIFSVTERCNNMDANTFLRKHCKISSRMITRLKREPNGITCNGGLLKTIDILKTGDIVTLNLPDDKNEIVPVSGELDILYEDNHIIVLNKPHSMPVHPTKTHQTDTLANRVVYYAVSKKENYSIRIINRLDRDTSGAVVVAKDRFTAYSLSKTIKKEYIAVCGGRIEHSGTINASIKLMDGSKMLRCICKDGDKAVTHFTPIEYSNNRTMLKVILETGRTHQIRCHFSSIGHPLEGDDLYAGNTQYIKRQALHCHKVDFLHPITAEHIKVHAKVFEDIENLMK